MFVGNETVNTSKEQTGGNNFTDEIPTAELKNNRLCDIMTNPKPDNTVNKV